MTVPGTAAPTADCPATRAACEDARADYPFYMPCPTHDRADPARPAAASPGTPEALAQRFHEAYERLAPAFGYKTREASAVPWADVPAGNKALMIAVCAELSGVMPSRPAEGCTGVAARWCPVHGDCTCPEALPDRTVDQPPMDSYGCPLHGDKSSHAEGLVDGTPEPDGSVRAAEAPVTAGDELADAVLAARAAHTFADWTTCECGFKPDDLNGWRRHRAEVTVAAVRPPIEADLIRRSEEAEEAALAEMLADSEFLGMAPNGEGGIDLRVKLAAKLAAGLVDAAKGILEVHPDARNYLEQEVIDRATGDRYVIIFCRPGGQTPHELRRKAEQEADRLRVQLTRALNEIAENT